MRASDLFFSVAVFGLSSTAGFAIPIEVTDFASLSSAIETANANPNSQIYLAPGVYSGGALPEIRSSVTLSINPGAQPGSAILRTAPTAEKGILTVATGASPINL